VERPDLSHFHRMYNQRDRQRWTRGRRAWKSWSSSWYHPPQQCYWNVFLSGLAKGNIQQALFEGM